MNVCNWALAARRLLASASLIVNVATWWIAGMGSKCQHPIMPQYEPIETGVRLNAVASDLLSFRWETNGISADFILPDDDEHALRISFDGPCIVRLLDEMALSTEGDDTPKQGLIPNHFAYRLKGARFARAQSETWKEVSAPVGQSVVHYRFITGWACMDILSGMTPTFSIVVRTS